MDATTHNREILKWELSRRFNESLKGWRILPDMDMQEQFTENLEDITSDSPEPAANAAFNSYAYIVEAEEVLASSKIGKALLRSSNTGHVITRIDNQHDGPAAYHAQARVVLVNPGEMAHCETEKEFVGQMVHTLAHEHFHAYQQRQGLETGNGQKPAGTFGDGAIRPLRINPRDFLAHTLHKEAAAYTLQMMLAIDLAETHPEVESSLDDDLLWPDMYSAFFDVVESAADNPGMSDTDAENIFKQGCRAAHDAWLSIDSDYAYAYALDALDEYSQLLEEMDWDLRHSAPEDAAAKAAHIGSERISNEEMSKLASIPETGNYLALEGHPDATSDKYLNSFDDEIEKKLSKIEQQIKDIKWYYVQNGPQPSPLQSAQPNSKHGI